MKVTDTVKRQYGVRDSKTWYELVGKNVFPCKTFSPFKNERQASSYASKNFGCEVWVHEETHRYSKDV